MFKLGVSFIKMTMLFIAVHCYAVAQGIKEDRIFVGPELRVVYGDIVPLPPVAPAYSFGVDVGIIRHIQDTLDKNNILGIRICGIGGNTGENYDTPRPWSHYTDTDALLFIRHSDSGFYIDLLAGYSYRRWNESEDYSYSAVLMEKKDGNRLKYGIELSYLIIPPVFGVRIKALWSIYDSSGETETGPLAFGIVLGWFNPY